MDKEKVVVIGGGNGTAVCLQSLKPYIDQIDLSAVVSTSDSGGSSGQLREEFGMIPTGDIMRAILSLSKHDYKLLRGIFYKKRFQDIGKVDNHNLGNLFLTLTGKYSNSIIDSMRALEQAVDAVGHVYPVSLDLGDLCVELSTGEIIKGEAEIDVPKYEHSKKITKAWIEPEINAYGNAVKAIELADYIILGVGSLYTSIIPNLLVKGIKEAIYKSDAKIIYIIGSCYEIYGETGPERLSDFVEQLQNYLPKALDTVIYSTHEFSLEEKKELEIKKWNQMEIDEDNLKIKNSFGFDFEKFGGGGDNGKIGPYLMENIIV